MIESYEPIIRILNALYSWTPTIELEPTPASVFRSHNWEWHKLCHNLCHSQNVNAFWRHKCSCFQHSNDLPVTPRVTDVIFDCFKRKLETFFVHLGLSDKASALSDCDSKCLRNYLICVLLCLYDHVQFSLDISIPTIYNNRPTAIGTSGRSTLCCFHM